MQESHLVCLCTQADILCSTFVPESLLVSETKNHKEDTNIMLLSGSCLIAGNEDLSHVDDAM